ncbi:hypothetical protein [Candidatus Albibeggiatoa sp. nov. BB20]|uniref:hypothetical protein n=1 Tax=Candidatus Albibeggiatoa sp. nov. BB20 TaxID=3162723 RepID=UPI003365AAE9
MSCDEFTGISYAKLLSILYQLCVTEKTGTLFITTWDNATVAIILREGLVSACTWEHERGLAAVRKIREVKTGHYVFSENVFFSLQQHNDLPITAQLLNSLGHDIPDNSPLLQRQSESSKCYRGATIACDESAREEKHSPIVYRGVVMNEQEVEMEEAEDMAYTPMPSSNKEKRRTYRGCHY